MTRLRRAVPYLIVVVLSGSFLLVISGGLVATAVSSGIDDIGEMLAAATASFVCIARARRRPETARSWRLIGAGALAWALGEAVWSYYDIVAGRQTPFPSVADVGFLLFPVLAGIGLLLWPSNLRHRSTRWRAVLDGSLMGGALLLVSWATALGSTYRSVADGWFAFAVSLAYPVSDLMLLTLTLMIVTHRQTRGRSGLGSLAAGIAALCVADSAFAYLTSNGTYGSGTWTDAGWVGGFLLIAVAALSRPRPERSAEDDAPVESTGLLLIPYVPACLGLGVATVYEIVDGSDVFIVVVATWVLVILLTRQLLAVLENRQLAERLVAAQEELRHLAFRDPLTGAANRIRFTERAAEALSMHERSGRPLGLIYCDLDDFKEINDNRGHEVGDLVLQQFAQRLHMATRPSDTVARLGGDEFAVLVHDGGDAAHLAQRLLDLSSLPIVTEVGTFSVSASIGVVEVAEGDRTPDHAHLLRLADAAMYDAKREGKHTIRRRSFGADPDGEVRAVDLALTGPASAQAEV